LQIVAQKNVPPTIASLLMSLESVFSALAGWILLKQAMTGRELVGCVLVFAAVLLAQIPISAFGKRVKK
jgi:drug/metabolite transporter (DMT)-like permease